MKDTKSIRTAPNPENDECKPNKQICVRTLCWSLFQTNTTAAGFTVNTTLTTENDATPSPKMNVWS